MQGYTNRMILGIDEVGRGPWAGPLVVGAVVLPDIFDIPGLTDSKVLSAARRKQLDTLIKQQALGYGLGWVYPDELDILGLSRSLAVATQRAVEQVATAYHEIVIDGTINFLKGTTKAGYVTTLPKADAIVPAVSAASIIAKVARDAYMAEQAAYYPQYGFEAHVGYGTSQHREALQAHGVTPLHRRSFAPIKNLVEAAEQLASGPVMAKTTKVIGDMAEVRVAELLELQGYRVLKRNWRTKYCEIDIIAQKGNELVFVEVKYRSSALQGGALGAITPKKMRQMRFAAELFLSDMENVYGDKPSSITSKLVAAIIEGSADPRLVQVA